MGLSRRQFTKEFKLAAVRRLEQGVSIGEAARALEVGLGLFCNFTIWRISCVPLHPPSTISYKYRIFPEERRVGGVGSQVAVDE